MATDPVVIEKGKLATYRIQGEDLLKTVDGHNWRLIFSYGLPDRLYEICQLLNNSAIGLCDWLRKELNGDPTIVIACDDCPLFQHPATCGHPTGRSKQMTYVAGRRPDWCPLVGEPLYLKAAQA